MVYLVATDDTSSSSTRASVIHKEKFNVLLSGDEHNAKSKCLGEKPEVTIVISRSFIILRYKKFFFAGAFKNSRKFKISSEGANLHLTYIRFCSNDF